jgi:hypothetical protein
MFSGQAAIINLIVFGLTQLWLQWENEKFFSYIMARTSYIRWDENDIRFILDLHSEMHFYSAIG